MTSSVPFKEAGGPRILCAMKWPVGGIRSYIAYNYPALLDVGYRVTFVGPDCPEFAAFRNHCVDWPDVEFVPAPRSAKGYQFLRTIRAQLRSGRFAVMHTQGVSLAAAAVVANFGIGVPHACTSHYTFQAGRPMRGVQGALKRFALTRLLLRLDALIAVSNDALDDHLRTLTGLRYAAGKVVAIPNGIDTQQFDTAACRSNGELRQQLGIADNTFLLGYFGRFMQEKGFPILIEAMDELVRDFPELPVHLVAVGSGDYEREYKRDVQSRPRISHRVSFLPFQADPSELMRQVQLVVVPSHCEACGLLPMEAMCLGIPVLGSNCLGLREVLRDTPSRLVVPGNPSALAHGIAEVVRNPFSKAAHDYIAVARERFDVRKASNALHALINNLVDSSRPRR